MDFRIRAANEDDLPAMLSLWREMMDFHAERDRRFRPKPSPGGERAWAKYLREDIWMSENCCVLVAEADGRLVGQILGELRELPPVFEPKVYGYVTDIIVHRKARRRGVGRALFKRLGEWMRSRGAEHLQLQVMSKNDAAQAFWRAMNLRDYLDLLWYELEVE